MKTFVESLDGKRTLINKAYVVMVAIDEFERPTEVPGLIIETEEEQAEWDKAVERNKIRKQRRTEN